jgi:signal peptidase I
MVPVVGQLTGYIRLLPILSGSMTPAFPTGSLAIATPSPLTHIRTGDVIVFHVPVGDHHVIAHRIVRILKHGADPMVQTKGDANSAIDPWIAHLHGDQIWVVRAGIPLLGYAAVYAKRALAAVLILLAVTAIAVALLRRIWRQPVRMVTEPGDDHASLGR